MRNTITTHIENLFNNEFDFGIEKNLRIALDIIDESYIGINGEHIHPVELLGTFADLNDVQLEVFQEVIRRYLVANDNKYNIDACIIWSIGSMSGLSFYDIMEEYPLLESDNVNHWDNFDLQLWLKYNDLQHLNETINY